MATRQVKAFNANRIVVTYTPFGSNTFATIKTVKVDNVRPALITQSPAIPLITKARAARTSPSARTSRTAGAGFRPPSLTQGLRWTWRPTAS